MSRSPFAALACLTLLAAGGCGPGPMVQVETTIRPDGSCERSVWQPRDRLLPDEAFTPAWIARWRKVEDVVVPPAFAENDPDPGEGYFHAVGEFASPADVPPHFLKDHENRPELGAGGMTREYHRRDFGPFVEHRWAETLANGVTREGFEKAREEFLDAAMPMLAEGFERVYGGEFDVSEAMAELDRRGRPLFRDLADAWYDSLAAAAEDPRALDDAMKNGFVAAIERAGVDLRDDAGDIVDSAEGDRRVRDFLAERIAATFRRKDGSPPTPDDVRAILGGPENPSFADAWRQYGTDRKSDVETKLAPPLARMTGPYFFPGILAPPGPRFAFDLRLPGLIVPGETNGQIIGAGKVSWRFEAVCLFPTAYTMSAVSVEIDAPTQRRLLGRVAIRDAADATPVRELLVDAPELLESLRRAFDTGDLSALDDEPETDDARRTKLARLREMLGMPH
ncbi:hypothetical protein [Paludisphaera sp.]|uniref:hypothetical protein n=1 Tax=Paludisphaera sp. TaxID=2017432 RepID=UPI00301DC2B4